MAQTIEDEGRNSLLTKGSSKGHDAIREDLVQHGLIARHKGNLYIYISAINQWGVLVSPEAQRQICTLTGSESATVNYLSASIPYVKFIDSNAIISGSIPVSICIGTRRLAISKSDDGLILTQCENVASVSKSLDNRISSFCIMPSMFRHIPQVWKREGAKNIKRYMNILFRDEVELQTLLWIIGSIAVDPTSRSKYLFLYGPGGTGKSTVINIIEDLFRGCCGTLPSALLTDKYKNISVNEAGTIASNRVVVAGDINLSEETSLNYHVVKEITGHDSIAIPPFSVRTRCTLVSASNALPDPLKERMWFSEAVARRLIVLPMDVKPPTNISAERPESDDEMLDLLLECVSVYLENTEYPPMSFRSLMTSVMGSKYYSVSHILKYDPQASAETVVRSNVEIEQALGLDNNTIGELAKLRCPEYTVQYGEICYIKGLVISS